MTRYRWYRGVGTLDPQSRWIPPLGPVGLPNSMGNSMKGDLYTYIHPSRFDRLSSPLSPGVKTMHFDQSAPPPLACIFLLYEGCHCNQSKQTNKYRIHDAYLGSYPGFKQIAKCRGKRERERERNKIRVVSTHYIISTAQRERSDDNVSDAVQLRVVGRQRRKKTIQQSLELCSF